LTFDDDKTAIVDFPGIDIPIKSVLRRLGYPSSEKFPEGQVAVLFQKAIRSAPGLLEPRAVFRILSVACRSKSRISFQEAAFIIHSDHVAKMLKKAEKVVFFMVTIGSNLEEKVKQYMDAGNLTEGVILDAIGSETADAVADRLHHDVLKKIANEAGFSITPRFSPGYGDWPVTVQKDVLNVCDGSQIGISVNDSFLMQPRKSVSAVLGWNRMLEKS
jgi:hypothetical protein